MIETHPRPARRLFIECGINDGLQHSNTLALEQSFGWKGWLVEADPDVERPAQENRPACRHATCALSVSTARATRFTRGGQWGGLTAFLPEAWRREQQARHAQEIWVTTVTLRDPSVALRSAQDHRLPLAGH